MAASCRRIIIRWWRIFVSGRVAEGPNPLSPPQSSSRRRPGSRPWFYSERVRSRPLRLPCRRSGQASPGRRDGLFHLRGVEPAAGEADALQAADDMRSEEHTSELQSLMRHSSAVFCLKKKKTKK